MEDLVNVNDQNNQQLGQNPINQNVQPPKKTNYWMISTLILVLIVSFCGLHILSLSDNSNEEKKRPIISQQPTETGTPTSVFFEPNTCSSKNLKISSVSLPNENWQCEEDGFDGTGQIKLFTDSFSVSILIGSRGFGCDGSDPGECETESFYEDDKVNLVLYKSFGEKISGIYGSFKGRGMTPMIEIGFGNGKARELTDKEKTELIKLLHSVSFSN